METNEPPHTGNLKGSSPLVHQFLQSRRPRPIHILLLRAHLIIRSHSPSLSVVYLLILPITLSDLHLRIGLAFCRSIHLWSIALLGSYQMCQWKLWAAAVGSFVLWHHCSPPPITETLSPSLSLFPLVLSPDKVCGETVDQYKRIHALFLSVPDSRFLDWQAVLACRALKILAFSNST